MDSLNVLCILVVLVSAATAYGMYERSKLNKRTSLDHDFDSHFTCEFKSLVTSLLGV